MEKVSTKFPKGFHKGSKRSQTGFQNMFQVTPNHPANNSKDLRIFQNILYQVERGIGWENGSWESSKDPIKSTREQKTNPFGALVLKISKASTQPFNYNTQSFGL